MKRVLIALLLFIAMSMFATADDLYNVKISELRSEPKKEAPIIYQIPVEVKFLDTSEDGNWHKVFIKFNLGPVEFKSTGWTYIPIGEILAARSTLAVKK